MARLSAVLAASVALGIGASAQAVTVPIEIDGSWNIFDVDEFISTGLPTDWISLDGSPIEFTFTTTAPVVVTVVDAGFAGDRFNVYDNGNLLGLTSIAVNSYPDSVGTDFAAALANSNYSVAMFELAAGSHVITGNLALSALDDLGDALNATVGAIRVVPLPASGLLLLGGSALVAAARRRFGRERA